MPRAIIALIAAVGFGPGLANASLITLDFNEPDFEAMNFQGPLSPLGEVSWCTEPYVEDGFRIQQIDTHFIFMQPEIHPSIISDETPWMAFTGAVFADYGVLRLDFFGQTFDIVSINAVIFNWGIMSPNGAVEFECRPPFAEVHPCNSGFYNVTGPGSRNVTYIDFFTTSGGATGFDNIVVRPLPEPGTLALLIAGLIGMALVRKQTRG